MSTLIRVLMAAAALTLLVASAVHSGLLGPIDPFDGAALPEAVIGVVLIAGLLGALFWWPGSWPVALGATLFAVLGTLVGLRFTLPRGASGDVAYRLSLLGTLLLLTVVLVRNRRHA